MDKEKIKEYFINALRFIGLAIFYIFIAIGLFLLFLLLLFFLETISWMSDIIAGILAGVIVVVLAVGVGKLYVHQWRHKRVKSLIGALSSLLSLAFIMSFVTFISLEDHAGPAPDTKRIGHLRQAQVALEIYKDDNGNYPVLNPGICESAEGKNRVMEVINMEGVADPEGDRQYMYSSNEDGKGYVLSARLDDKTHNALETDLDGNILGCDCDDPNYCVGP